VPLFIWELYSSTHDYICMDRLSCVFLPACISGRSEERPPYDGGR
jgi:hypothetical protein